MTNKIDEAQRQALADELGVQTHIMVERNDLEVKGIGGFLILVASLKIISILVMFSNISNASQLKVVLFLRKNEEVPLDFFLITDIGFMALLIMAVIVAIFFFKQKKLYYIMEIIQFAAQTIVFAAIYLSLTEHPDVVADLTELLSYNLIFSVGILIYLFFSKKSRKVFVKPFINTEK